MYYDAAGNTLFIAGTKGRKDVADDALIPLGLTRLTERYAEAKHAANEHHPTKLVGHSLGGAVALELGPLIHAKTVTYGAPVFSKSGGRRYAHFGDPVAAMDLGAQRNWYSGDPHSYRGFD